MIGFRWCDDMIADQPVDIGHTCRTRKQLSLEEISLVTRGLRGLVISPLMEKNRVFGTSTHMEIAKSYLRKMFLNEG